jgi:hypothetical protein
MSIRELTFVYFNIYGIHEIKGIFFASYEIIKYFHALKKIKIEGVMRLQRLKKE